MWCCYVLHNDETRSSYCGMTCDLPRRLRQHNRELAGGARATARGAGAWRVALAIVGFASHREALRAEWRLKHPSRGRWRGGGAAARAEALLEILRRGPAERWTSRSARIDASRLRVVGDAALVARLEDGVPVSRLRTLEFVPGEPCERFRAWAGETAP